MHAARMTRFCSSALLTAFALIILPGPSRAAVELPGKQTIEKVDFERHVMGVFGRVGCNSGSCHGSFQGKNGFRLSLFGYDPEKDYLALTREAEGRRTNPRDPDASLLLLKATGQVNHGGGPRFNKDSWQYKLLREWIADGAQWTKGSGEVKAITVTPTEYAFTGPEQNGQVKVKATFGDGSEEDITLLCDFRVNDDAVAEVTPLGQVKSLRPGDTALVAAYRGNVLAVRLLVPTPSAQGFKYPDVPENNYLDKEVFAKLRRLNVVPSDLSTDTEFLRRVTIDTIGCLPSPEEVRAFMEDKSADKRAKKIDHLLNHPMHAALWATKLCDVTGNNTLDLEGQAPMQAKLSQMWHDWIRKRVADNMPYDELVRGILCSTSRDGLQPDEWLKQFKAFEDSASKGFDTAYADRPSLDLFWRKRNGNVPLEQWGEKAAAAFMGVRLECAQCHKHPFDRWTQTEYRSFANVFGQVTYGISPEAKSVIDEENGERKKAASGNNKQQSLQVREVFVAERGRSLPAPDDIKPLNAKAPAGQPLGAKALGGPAIEIKKGVDARVELFQWLRSPDNPYFARSFVNRVWGHYFGVGLVEPVDNFSLANPPTNATLLDALAKDFIEHKYDLRYLERTILSARVYQLSSRTNDTNKFDRNNYSHSYLRPMMAEVVVDVLNSALGTTENFGADAPAGCRAIEVGSSRVQNPTIAYVFRTFGRPPRTSACDCERAMDPALPQKLFLMTDPALKAKFDDPKGRLHTANDPTKTSEEVLDELFLATLSRFPTDNDKKLFAEYQKKTDARDRKTALEGALWALINTREFILNH
jgi:hypothetical protein